MHVYVCASEMHVVVCELRAVMDGVVVLKLCKKLHVLRVSIPGTGDQSGRFVYCCSQKKGLQLVCLEVFYQ